jgi:enoyl-CoA hydratase/carnithine racemase
MTSSEVLSVERRGAAALLTIERPHAGNSISAEVTTALDTALSALESERELAAIVITGAGDKFFSAGGDIKQYRELVTREQLQRAFERPRRLLDRLEALPVPVIAAVNGIAMGGGAELMLACDMRLAAPTATIGFPYVRLGLIPGWHGTERLARTCGYANAMHLLATGDPVDAEEARRLGLINRVCDDMPVVDAALALVEKLARAAPLSLAATKRVLLGAFQLPREQARRLAEAEFTDLWMSGDHREAEAAFAVKRRPEFKGK